MEFINIKNINGKTIINDSYDNLVYLSFPKQKAARIYKSGNLKVINSKISIPVDSNSPYTPTVVGNNDYRYKNIKPIISGGINRLQVTYIIRQVYHGESPIIAVTVPSGYEFEAENVVKRQQGIFALVVNIVKGGNQFTEQEALKVANDTKFYCFGYFEDMNEFKGRPRLDYINKEKGKNVALQVLGKHKFWGENWVKYDILYDSRIRYMRVLDHYGKDFKSQLSNYNPEMYADMSTDPKSYGCKVAVVPLSTVDAQVWGPNINRGDGKSHTVAVWNTIKFINGETVKVNSYQSINWDTVTTLAAGCTGSTATQYMVVDVTGYDKTNMDMVRN